MTDSSSITHTVFFLDHNDHRNHNSIYKFHITDPPRSPLLPLEKNGDMPYFIDDFINPSSHWVPEKNHEHIFGDKDPLWGEIQTVESHPLSLTQTIHNENTLLTDFDLTPSFLSSDTIFLPQLNDTEIMTFDTPLYTDTISTKQSSYLENFIDLEPSKRTLDNKKVSDKGKTPRKRKNLQHDTVDSTQQKKHTIKTWDPKKKQVVELVYSSTTPRKKKRIDDKNYPISWNAAYKREIIGKVVKIDDNGNPISKSTTYDKTITPCDNDKDKKPIPKSTMSNRAIIAFEDNGKPIPRSTAFGRTILAYNDDGTPISRSTASSRIIVGYNDDGKPISRSQASSNAIIGYDNCGKPVSRATASGSAIVGYDRHHKPVSRNTAWCRYLKNVPRKDRIPRTGFKTWCTQNLTQKPTKAILRNGTETQLQETPQYKSIKDLLRDGLRAKKGIWTHYSNSKHIH